MLVESALRASPDANPPLNMKRAYVFQGIFVCICVSLVFLIEGKQVRRQQDVDVLLHGEGVMTEENGMQVIIPIDSTNRMSAVSEDRKDTDMRMDIVDLKS